MPKLPAPPPEVLDRLLERTGADSFELPALVTPRDEGPGWLERLIQWMMSFFPNRGPSKPGDWLGILLKGIAILGAIMIVVAVVSMIYNAVKRARQRAEDAKYGLKRGAGDLPPRERLVVMLEDALRRGSTAEAARIRWKLFLVRKKLPGSVTPGETEGFGRYYELMFGATPGSEALIQYNDLDLSLRAREVDLA